METVEKTMTMEDGVEYHYWTFNGDVPGQMIRVREGDTVEVEFSNNPSSTFLITLTSTLLPVKVVVQKLPLLLLATLLPQLQALQAGLYIYTVPLLL